MAHPLFDVSHLTAAERAQFAADLWNGVVLAYAGDLAMPEEHRADFLRRLAVRQQRPEPAVP